MNTQQKFLASLGIFSLFGSVGFAQVPPHQELPNIAATDMRQMIKELDLSRFQKRMLKDLRGEGQSFQADLKQREKEIQSLTDSGNHREADYLRDLLEADQAAHREEQQLKFSDILTPEQRAQMASFKNSNR